MYLICLLQRFFALEHGKLNYFSDEIAFAKGETAKGTIDLATHGAVPSPSGLLFLVCVRV